MAIDFENSKPLYLQIIDDIKSEINSGVLKVGDQVGSQNELAQKYKVSLITVKKALSELIKEGILFSRVGKGTYIARRHAQTKSISAKTFGLVLQDLKSPFFSLIAQEAEAHAFDEGYNILLTNVSGKVEKEEGQIRHFRDIGVSGLLIASMSHKYFANQTIRQLHNEGFPYVMVSYNHDPDIYFVGTDHEYGGYIATDHLIKQGYENIGFINGEIGNVVGQLRYEGFRRCMQDNGLKTRDEYIMHLPLGGEWNDFKSGYQLGKEFVTKLKRPEAMFIYNDLSALGFLRALLEHGVQVPEEVALVGFDDIDRASYARVPLTTVRQPIKDIASIAIDVLIKRKTGEDVPVRTILKPELVVRQSSVGSIVLNE